MCFNLPSVSIWHSFRCLCCWETMADWGHSWSKDISIPEATGCKCPGWSSESSDRCRRQVRKLALRFAMWFCKCNRLQHLGSGTWFVWWSMSMTPSKNIDVFIPLTSFTDPFGGRRNHLTWWMGITKAYLQQKVWDLWQLRQVQYQNRCQLDAPVASGGKLTWSKPLDMHGDDFTVKNYPGVSWCKMFLLLKYLKKINR